MELLKYLVNTVLSQNLYSVQSVVVPTSDIIHSLYITTTIHI